ncbi:methyltransferase [Toxoplasma gondii TgCatPRC2]|uniref:Methyltransferase n=2 Tax=Toxoplasma gondii TaxID=5811 RepID=A0A151H462_TOXGO|nr:methyltransferase [Toxoplasma gondii ARI]KYK64119.1 methyltransferase [Toxoplasma gondii TgCatPRC2]
MLTYGRDPQRERSTAKTKSPTFHTRVAGCMQPHAAPDRRTAEASTQESLRFLRSPFSTTSWSRQSHLFVRPPASSDFSRRLMAGLAKPRGRLAGVAAASQAVRGAAFTLFLSVRKGLEPVLVRELRTSPSLRDLCGSCDASSGKLPRSDERKGAFCGEKLDASPEKKRPIRLQSVQGGVVLHNADWELATRVCTYSRIAETVWLRLAHSGACTTEQRLENALTKVKWKEFFPDLSLLPLVPLRVASFSSTLCNENRIRQVVEKTLKSLGAEHKSEAAGQGNVDSLENNSAFSSPLSSSPSMSPSSASLPSSASPEIEFVKAVQPARRLLEALNFRFSLTLASDSLFVDMQLSPRLTPRPYLYLSRFFSPSCAGFSASTSLPSPLSSSPPSPLSSSLSASSPPASFACSLDTSDLSARSQVCQGDNGLERGCASSADAQQSLSVASCEFLTTRSSRRVSDYPQRPSAFPVLRELLRAHGTNFSGSFSSRHLDASEPTQSPQRSDASRFPFSPLSSSSSSSFSDSSASSAFLSPWSLAAASRAIREEARRRLLRDRSACDEPWAETETPRREHVEACGDGGPAPPRNPAASNRVFGTHTDAAQEAGGSQRGGTDGRLAEFHRERETRGKAAKHGWQRSAFEKLLDAVSKAEELAKKAAQTGKETGDAEANEKVVEATRRESFQSTTSSRGNEANDSWQHPDLQQPRAPAASPHEQSLAASPSLPSSSSDSPSSLSSSPALSSPALSSPALSSPALSSPALPSPASSSVSSPWRSFACSDSPFPAFAARPNDPLSLPVEVELLRLQHLHLSRRQAAAKAAGVLPPAALPSALGLVEAFESDDATAAAVALASGIKRACRREKDVVVWDPFCGDGGLLMEVALLIKDTLPVCPGRIPSPLSRLRSRMGNAETTDHFSDPLCASSPSLPPHLSSSSVSSSVPSSVSSSVCSSVSSSSPSSSWESLPASWVADSGGKRQGVVTLVGSDERALLLCAARQRVNSFHAFYSRSEASFQLSPSSRDSTREAVQCVARERRSSTTSANAEGDSRDAEKQGSFGAAGEIPAVQEEAAKERHRDTESGEEEEDATAAIQRRASQPMFTVGPSTVSLSSLSQSSASSPRRHQLDGEAREAISFDELIYGASERKTHPKTEQTLTASTRASTATQEMEGQTGEEKESTNENQKEQNGEEQEADTERQGRRQMEEADAKLKEKIYVPGDSTAWGTESLPFRIALLHAPHHQVAPFLRGAFVLTRMPGRREGEFMGSAHKKAVLLYERFGHLIASRDDWRAVYVLTKGSAFQHYSRLDWERVLTWRDVSDQPLQLLRWTGRKRALYASTTKTERERILEEIDMRLDASDA